MCLDSQGGPDYIDTRWYIFVPPSGTLLLRRLQLLQQWLKKIAKNANILYIRFFLKISENVEYLFKNEVHFLPFTQKVLLCGNILETCFHRMKSVVFSTLQKSILLTEHLEAS